MWLQCCNDGTRQMFQHVSQALSLLGSVGWYLRIGHISVDLLWLILCLQTCWTVFQTAMFHVSVYSFCTVFALYLLFVSGMLVTILGNSLVSLSVCHFKQLHSPTNMLISSLALVDLLVGVIVMPFSATRTVHGCWFYGDTFCHLHFSFEVLLTTLSIFHLICIAVDIKQGLHKLQAPLAVMAMLWFQRP